MKKFFTLFVLALFVSVSLPTTVMANAQKGQRIYKKKFRKKCGFSGVRFSRSHTQEEWKKLYEAKEFKEEAKKLCPRLEIDKIKAPWWEHVYDFSYRYAKDGAVPKC
jgi:hypothetical protein